MQSDVVCITMAERLTVSLTERSAARVRERADLECRSVSNMLERLVELGLARLDDRDAFLNDPPAPPVIKRPGTTQ